MKDNYFSCPPFSEMRFGNGDIIVAVPEKKVFHVLSGRGNNVLVVETDPAKLPYSGCSTTFFTMSVHEAADKGYLRYKEYRGKKCSA